MLPSEDRGLTVAAESARTDDAQRLLRSAEVELRARYPDYDCPVFPAEAVETARAAFFVARSQGEAVGGLALRPMGNDWPDAAELKRLWVHPNLRGRGVARALLAFAEAWAQNAGYTALMLETGIGQPEALALYSRVGYDRISCWGEYADDAVSVCYAKNLGSTCEH